VYARVEILGSQAPVITSTSFKKGKNSGCSNDLSHKSAKYKFSGALYF
jgi:hypothetical protein